MAIPQTKSVTTCIVRIQSLSVNLSKLKIEMMITKSEMVIPRWLLLPIILNFKVLVIAFHLKI